MHQILKMLSAEVVCCKKLPNITDELSIEANSVDPEQTSPIGAVCSGSTLFTPATRACAIYRTPLGCYENPIRSDLFIYPSHRSVFAIEASLTLHQTRKADDF